MAKTVATPKTVVILGAGWAGLPLAHKLLKYTLPKVKEGLKVYLVSPNSHFYWNIAAVRGVIPGAIPDEQLFLPIEPGFTKFTFENFEFVRGKAESLNTEQSTATVAKNDGTQISLTYDQLVIATGSQVYNNLPFKPVGTHGQTLDAFHSLQNQIEAAKSIVVAGSGPTGVETAGELAAHYGAEKEITLIINGDYALHSSKVLPNVSQIVEQDLQKLGVKLLHKTQVMNAQEDATGNTILSLSNGLSLITDLYLPLFGMKVNTSFVPSNLLDPAGNLALDMSMKVVGTKNIWGIGDVGNLEVKQVTVTDAQIIHLATALHLVLSGKEDQVKEYKPSEKMMVFITMGKKYATGQIGGWKLPGWMVSYPKGRALFVDTASAYVNGKRLRHASM
jgi:NADH dehydrogenase FAD-containing subunit